MSKRRKIVLVLICLTVPTLIVLLGPLAREKEPAYQGKTLSEWLDAYLATESVSHVLSEQQERASAAIRHMGTNTLTNLLAWIRYEPGSWQKQLGAHDFTRFLEPFTYSSRRLERASAAQDGFKILGPIGSPAIPELVSIINDTNSPYAGHLALDSLAYLGDSAVTPMAQILSNTNCPQHRRAPWAVFSMSYLGEEASPLVPLLVKCTQSPDPHVAEGAVQALGSLLLLPELSIPALTNSLAHRDDNIRAWAVRSLRNFKSAARPAVPALLAARSDPYYLVRDLAADTLEVIAPEVLTNSPPH